MLLVALAGGVGACLRYLVDLVVTRRAPTSLPVATLVVNVLGSLLLGALAQWGTEVDAGWWATSVLGVGLLGGFTTFSTASVELVLLVRRERPVAAVVLALSMLVLSLAAAVLGMLVVRGLAG